MLMAVLEGRAPNPRPHHAVEVTVTPFSQPRMKATCGPRGAPQGRKIYVNSIDEAKAAVTGADRPRRGGRRGAVPIPWPIQCRCRAGVPGGRRGTLTRGRAVPASAPCPVR